jgi:hypothetical protein
MNTHEKEHEMKHHASTWVAIAAAVLLGGSAVAQQTQRQKPTESQGKPQYCYFI